MRGSRRRARAPRERRAPVPLGPAKLEELALSYVARFATSAAKLRDYLMRKLRERGWEGEDDAAEVIAALTVRFVDAGYVDDEAFARARSGSLLRRGFGARRISQALGAAGIAEHVRDTVRAGQDEERAAALAFARKKRLGPFGPPPADRPAREKQIAAMLRAGHRLDSARKLVDCRDQTAAEDWSATGD